MANSKKEWVKIFLLVVISISLTFLILELSFRVFCPVNFYSFISHSTKSWTDADVILNRQAVRISRTLGYEWVPNVQKGWLRTNSLGMYDRQRQKYKPPGTYRIICLGDSTTANSDYVRMLEALLNRGEQRYEVWNCAVTKYNLIQYCRALKEKWIKFDPDMVIIGFCLNDFTPTPLVVKEDNRIVGYFPDEEVLPAVNPFLLKHSALYRFIAAKLFFSKNVDYSEKMIQTSRAYLRQTKDLLSAKNARFLIVILGLTKRFEENPKTWRDNYVQIKQIINDYSINSLDTVPLFQQNNPESLMLHDELHFNQKGSTIVAETIYAYLKQKLKKE